MSTRKPTNIMVGVDFYTKPRNRKWIKSEGAEAIIVLQAAWIAISQSGTFSLSREDAEELPLPLPIESLTILHYLDSAVKVGLLEWDEDRKCYTNSKTKGQVEEYQSKGKNKSEAALEREAKKRAEREANNNPSAHEPQPTTTESTTEPQQIPQGQHNAYYTILSDPILSDPNNKNGVPTPPDDVGRDQLLAKLRGAGLKSQTLYEDALEVAKSQYGPFPSLKQLNMPWIIRVLLEKETAKNNLAASEKRLERAASSPGDADFERVRKNFLEKEMDGVSK